ncbi:hypothetical protein GRJ2_001495500 [Grus japonensis]|uniref:Uncharacterized protein n=1 Tax=Grus japonensis TaxID=30415 RepID=A0ABC9X0N6_GRUJA
MPSGQSPFLASLNGLESKEEDFAFSPGLAMIFMVSARCFPSPPSCVQERVDLYLSGKKLTTLDHGARDLKQGPTVTDACLVRPDFLRRTIISLKACPLKAAHRTSLARKRYMGHTDS